MVTMYFLEPGRVYKSIDSAVEAACCMSSQHPEGATVYGTTEGTDVSPETGEAYQIACKVTRPDGTTWSIPPAPYQPIYTITRHAEKG